MSVTFFAYGDPKPQGSKRAFVTKQGRAVLVESSGQALKDWRTDLAVQARASLAELDWTVTDEPVSCALTFSLRAPKRPKYAAPVTRPDIDKLARSVLDALTTAGAWRDDSQVVELRLAKVYGDPSGVEVTLWRS